MSSSVPIQRRDISEELMKSQKVFSEKLNHLSRRLAWINVTIYSKVRGENIMYNVNQVFHLSLGPVFLPVVYPKLSGTIPNHVLQWEEHYTSQ